MDITQMTTEEIMEYLDNLPETQITRDIERYSGKKSSEIKATPEMAEFLRGVAQYLKDFQEKKGKK